MPAHWKPLDEDEETIRGTFWDGEEDFDAAIPRSRADYADIERDLLREPIFNPKVHERLSKLFLGQATVEELWKKSNVIMVLQSLEIRGHEV